jgi:hypothetical protein
MGKEENQQAYILIGVYQQLWKSKYGKVVVVNRYKRKWDLLDVVETIGYDRAREVMEYYFTCNKPGHPLEWFLSNFDKLDVSMKKLQEDKVKRTLVRARTKQLVEEEDIEYRSSSDNSNMQE